MLGTSGLTQQVKQSLAKLASITRELVPVLAVPLFLQLPADTTKKDLFLSPPLCHSFKKVVW